MMPSPITGSLRAPVTHRTRFLRFLVTGVVNTGFGYGVFLLGLLVGLEPSLALALQFALGIPFNFIVHGQFVFGPAAWSRIPLYALAYGALYGANLCALAVLVPLLPPAAAQAVLLLPMAALSFVLLSRIMR